MIPDTYEIPYSTVQVQTIRQVVEADLHKTTITQFIEVNEVQCAYRILGNKGGIPLILLQHFTGTIDDWDPAVTNGLAKHFPVVLFDNKGIGASGGQTPSTIKEMAEDAISFIKALGVEKVNLLGFSMGGFIAQEIALKEPGLINKMILAGTVQKGAEGLADITEHLAESATMTPHERKLYFFYNQTSASRTSGELSLARINKRTVNRDPDTTAPAVQAQLTSILGWAQPDAEEFDRLKQIEQPVLVVNGSNDIICPTIYSYILFQNLPNAKLSLYPDSGHGSIFQYHELFLAEAIPFLES